MRIVRVLAVLAAASALAACSGGTSGTSGTAVDLTGRWTLVSGTTADGEITVIEDAPVTFDVAANTTVSGRSGCNQYQGAVTVDGAAVSFGTFSSTAMACAPDVMALEDSFRAALADIDSGSRDGDTLVLTGAGTELTFTPTT